MRKPKTKRPVRKTKVIGASLTPEDVGRLNRYGAHVLATMGLRAKPGTLVAMLVRKGLDKVEEEARE